MEIRRGLDEEHVAAAAQIYWSAFSAKIGRALGPEALALRYFARVLERERALCAYENGQLIGVIGYDFGAGGFVGGDFRDLFAVYGATALWRAIILSRFAVGSRPNALLIEGFAVVEGYQGKGVGSKLLKEVEHIALRHDCREIVLDVIDKNQRAIALYERMGFETVNYSNAGLMAPILGFQISIRMVKRI